MNLSPQVCKKNYKVAIPTLGDNCEFWLVTVTDEQAITNPDKDHAYYTNDGKLYIFDGRNLIRVNCDICFTQEEREKLEAIEEGANKYVLPVASSTELGGVLLGYTQNGRNYPITKDTKGNIYVNVPWEEYQLPKATDNALGGIKTGYKQNGKFYPIKTDTDGNAYVQVPWEDTNTVYEVVSKTSNGLAPMLPSDENASKRFLNGDGEWVVRTDNSINGVTQTGSTFSGETSDCGVEITKVVGKTVQQTTNGYQLFDTSKITNHNGITVTHEADGSFTLNGEAVNNYDRNIINTYGSTDVAITSGLKLKANVNNTNIRVIVGNGEEEFRNLPLSTNIQDFNASNISWVIFRIYNKTSVDNLNLKIMLYQDGDGTWEPFTGGKPAPNPDYPMEIENVKISEITGHGRNILKDVTYGYNSSYTYIFSNKKIPEIFGVIKPNTTYTVFLFGMDLNGAQFRICNRSTENDQFGIKIINNNKVVFTTRNVLKDIRENVVYISTSLSSEQISQLSNLKIMIVEGNVSDNLDYEPYKSATVKTSLKLAQDDIYQQGTITRARKQVTFDGSSDEVWTVSSSPNTFYVTLSDKSTETSNEMLSNRFVKIEKTTPVASLESGQMKEDGNNPKIVYFKVDGISGVDNFKTWLSTHNTVVEYKLATPKTATPKTIEFKVPTIPSYYPYTEISTNSVVDPTITFRPLPFTTCLVGEATEEESGYMPPLSGYSNEFLNGNGEWSVPSGYTLPTASSTVLGGVKIGENITISSGTISIDKENVTNALGYTPPTTNTTYNLATTSANGLLKKLNGSTNSFMAGDGNWKDIISVIDSRISAKILTFFPVGTVIQTTNSANPSTYLGGTWEAFAPGRVLIGAGEGNDGTTSMSFTANGSGGKYYPKPRALIGAVNDDTGSIGYSAANPVSKASYSYAVSTSPVGISSINHSTEIKNEDGSEPTTIQPYIVVYRFRRTA